MYLEKSYDKLQVHYPINPFSTTDYDKDFSQHEAYNISFWINQMHTYGAYVINYVILKYIIFYTKSNYWPIPIISFSVGTFLKRNGHRYI